MWSIVLWPCCQNKASFHTVEFSVLSTTFGACFCLDPKVLLLLQA